MKTKFNLNRKTLPPEYIESKQDFQKVVDGYKAINTPLWKKPWFYGPTTLAAIVLTIGLYVLNDQEGRELQPETTQIAASSTVTTDLEDTPCIRPLSETSDLAFEVYAIDPQKGGTILLNSGSEISIPKNAFETKSKEIVEIRVREFKSKSEAFLAGIPMDYGKNSAFESAGMIELRASQNDQEVVIKNDKPLDVTLALYKNPESFGFWYLNENSKKWEKKDALFKNPDLKDEKIDVKKCATSLKVVEQKSAICQTEIDKIESEKPENSLLPTLGTRKLQIEFNEKDFPELKGYKDIEFEYVNYSEEIAKILKSQTWTDVELKKQNDYLAIFKNAKGQQAVKVRPVLKGKTLQDVQNQLEQAESFRANELEKLKKEKEALEAKRIELQARYDGLINELNFKSSSMQVESTRAGSPVLNANRTIANSTAEFQVTRWGLYNCDKPIAYPNEHPFELAYTDEMKNSLEIVSVYVFDLKKDTRYSYGYGSNKPLTSVGWFNNPSTVVAVDREGRIFMNNEVSKNDKNNNVLVLRTLDKKDLTIEYLKKVIRESTAVV